MNQRSFPYLWPTWLTKLLAGEDSCEYRAWFKAHYERYEKIDDGFDLAAWNEQHTALINRARAELEIVAPVKVFTENQNKFAWRHPLATIGGKPDLVAIRSVTDHLVVECKTGKHRDSDIVQAKIYIYALPRVLDRHVGREMVGQVVYGRTIDGRMEITKRVDVELDDGFEDRLMQLVGRVASPIEARAVPSEQECGFCELADCRYRWKPVSVATEPEPVVSVPVIYNPKRVNASALSGEPGALVPISGSLPLFDAFFQKKTEEPFDGIVYDCEIVRAIPGETVETGIEYCEGWQDYVNMQISTIGAYDYVEDRYWVFCQDNFDEFERLVAARRWTIGFNNVGFDNQLLNACGLNMPVNDVYDLLRAMWIADGLQPEFNKRTHGGYGLDPTCEINFGLRKSGNGVLAPVQWQRGWIGTVISYCINDVRLTKQLFDRVLSRQTLLSPKTNKMHILPYPGEADNAVLY